MNKCCVEKCAYLTVSKAVEQIRARSAKQCLMVVCCVCLYINHQRKWSCTVGLLCEHANTYMLLPTVLGLGNLQTCIGAHHKLQVSKALTSQCFTGAYLRGRASGAAGAAAAGLAFCTLGFLTAALILSTWAWSAHAWAAWTA